MKGKKLMGIFDWSPLEEFAPIWLTDRLVVIYSDKCEKRISKNAIPIKKSIGRLRLALADILQRAAQFTRSSTPCAKNMLTHQTRLSLTLATRLG